MESEDGHRSLPEGALWELVRELGEEHERAYVRWLERAIGTVEGLE